MMEHLGPGLARGWQNLGHPELDGAAVDTLISQIEAAYGHGPDAYRERAALRDRKQLAVNDALREAERT
ncbi:hypothetical protein [Nocardiopsis gilva]|nr:hypothetical protein [Nocardiopsis gilva]